MKITIPGIPIAKARPRFSGGNAYNSQKAQQQSIKWLIATKIREEKQLTPIEGPIFVTLDFYMPIPQSLNRAKINRILWGLIEHDIKPDIDNLEKWILDCCNKIIWNDDSQVVNLHSKKKFSQNPRTEIEIMVKKKETDDRSMRLVNIMKPEDYRELIEDMRNIFEQNISHGHEEENYSNLQKSSELFINFVDRWWQVLKKTREKK
jgi:Holliday junction resolvase RusA-like endonuclease